MSSSSSGSPDRLASAWSVRVIAEASSGATVFARSSKITVGTPLPFDVEQPHASALEAVLGALGADLSVGLKQTCAKKRLDVDRIETVVHGEPDNALVHLGVVGEEGSPKLRAIHIKLYVETLEEEDAIRGVLEGVLQRSCLYQTLAAAAACEIELRLVM